MGELEQYRLGFQDGYAKGYSNGLHESALAYTPGQLKERAEWGSRTGKDLSGKGKKRKPSAWNQFVKVNSKKPRFIYQSGAKKGKLNLKKMGVAWRRTPAGRKAKGR